MTLQYHAPLANGEACPIHNAADYCPQCGPRPKAQADNHSSLGELRLFIAELQGTTRPVNMGRGRWLWTGGGAEG